MLNKLLPKPETIPVLAPDPAPTLGDSPPLLSSLPRRLGRLTILQSSRMAYDQTLSPPAPPPYF